jgi:hypothetical protein
LRASSLRAVLSAIAKIQERTAPRAASWLPAASQTRGERLLQPLLGERALPAEPQQHREDRPLVAAVEQREGVPVPARDALDERVVGGRRERRQRRRAAGSLAAVS